MMSRFGFFIKPVIETTVYSVGVTAVGTGIYKFGSVLTESNQEKKDHEKAEFPKQHHEQHKEHDDKENISIRY